MAQNDIRMKYQIIYQYVVDRIASGEYKGGEKLPSEDEMCLLFSVSRITVRKAMGELEQAGYIFKRHSKGAFVRADVSTMNLNKVFGFSEEMKQRKLTPSSRVLQVSQKDAGIMIAAKLRIENSARVYCIKRLRLANEEPMAIETLYVPYYLFSNIDHFDLTRSFYDLVSKQYKLTISDSEQTISAGLAVRSEAQILGINLRSPVLRIERVTYLVNHMPMEYVDSVYRGDKYKFHSQMSRNAEAGRKKI